MLEEYTNVYLKHILVLDIILFYIINKLSYQILKQKDSKETE